MLNGSRPPLSSSMRCIRERSPVDSLTILTLSMVSDIRTNSCGLISIPLVAHHDRNLDRVTVAEKMLKNFAFESLQ